jgi:hypothetical protein
LDFSDSSNRAAKMLASPEAVTVVITVMGFLACPGS